MKINFKKLLSRKSKEDIKPESSIQAENTAELKVVPEEIQLSPPSNIEEPVIVESRPEPDHIAEPEETNFIDGSQEDLESSETLPEPDNNNKPIKGDDYRKPKIDKRKILLKYASLTGVVSYIFYSGPLAIIIGKKNNIYKQKVKKMNKFFICRLGLFELDSDFEYRFKKQSVSFFNSHETELDKTIVQKIETLYKKKNDNELIDYLKELEPKIKDIDFKGDVYQAMHDLCLAQKHLAIDLDTEKYLYGHIAYNPRSIKMAKEFVHHGKLAIESLSPRMNKMAIPLIVVMAVMIGLAIVAQHLSEWVNNMITFVQHAIH
jgi:hypothetical protein